MNKPIAITAHFDDAEIFLGAMPDQCERIYVVASPMRTDHARVMESERLPRCASWGHTSEYWWKEFYLDAERRKPQYHAQSIKDRVRWAMNDQSVYYGTREFLTHNPWGEYGHAHHRWTSAAVCDIAVEKDLTVWAPAHHIKIAPREWHLESCGLPARFHLYHREVYEYRRWLYREHEDELPSRLWTWPDDFPPPEQQTWICLVDEGADMRNHTVYDLMAETPVYGV